MTTKRLTILLCLLGVLLLCGCEASVGAERFTNPTPQQHVPETTVAPSTVPTVAPTTIPAPAFTAEHFADSLTLEQDGYVLVFTQGELPEWAQPQEDDQETVEEEIYIDPESSVTVEENAEAPAN